jgi:hypothetical protein
MGDCVAVWQTTVAVTEVVASALVVPNDAFYRTKKSQLKYLPRILFSFFFLLFHG